jgi:ABC-type oligopeptide transport system substrate-binding subunit
MPLAELKRQYGDIWIDLAQADRQAGRGFVEQLLDSEPNRLLSAFRERLHRRTGGHPLFTIELLRAMQARGDLVKDQAGHWVAGAAIDWDGLPARVEGVIELRIGRLEDDLRESLTIASVEGEEFTAQVVARIQEMGERQLLRLLSGELGKRHRLVREGGGLVVGQRILSRYRFAHALFQRYLYNELGEDERRRLHRETGLILEELHAGQAEGIARQLARHFEAAAMADKADEYLQMAGDQARTLYAHAEAIDFYHRALALLEGRQDHQGAARTLMKLGQTHHAAFQFRQARQVYDQAFALWSQVREAQEAAAPLMPPAPHALRTCWAFLTLDPGMCSDGISSDLINQLFSGLVEISPEGDVLPSIARSWEIQESGRRYLFHLRQDVRWSDGIPVTAGDFEYAWKRILSPENKSKSAGLFFDLKGGRAYHQGELGDADQVGVRALDEFSLAVELEDPVGHFLQILGIDSTFPVPRHAVEAHGGRWTRPEHIVTNGSFRLGALTDEHILLERNPAFHGRFDGNLQQVQVDLIDPRSWPDTLPDVMKVYEQDGYDMLHVFMIPANEWERVAHQHTGEFAQLPSKVVFYAFFDTSRPPFNDPLVRRAFAHSVDRGYLGKMVLRHWHIIASGGFVPPDVPGHSPGIGLPFDCTKARSLLAEAGYPGGRGFPHIIMASNVHPKACLPLQAQWQDELGVQVDWNHVPLEDFLDYQFAERPHIYLAQTEVVYPDPDSLLGGISERFRYLDWQNSAVEQSLNMARSTLDQAVRLQLYRQVDKILIDEAFFVPISYVKEPLLIKPWVLHSPKWSDWKDVVIEPHG